MTTAITWNGVMPAITTPFTADGDVDHAFLAAHARWMLDAGCTGIVALGSLGEAATLSAGEKLDVLRTLARALDGRTPRAPLVAGIAALSTDEACGLAREAAAIGCSGLMVLPPYVYSTDWREMRAHVAAVIDATALPCMLYNNPIAYRTDFRPEHVVELAQAHANLVAIKESSADVRRVTAIRHALGDRLKILVGVDDLIVEGIEAGATGWVAGLVNAMPVESVRLFELASRGKSDAAAKARVARSNSRTDSAGIALTRPATQPVAPAAMPSTIRSSTPTRISSRSPSAWRIAAMRRMSALDSFTASRLPWACASSATCSGLKSVR